MNDRDIYNPLVSTALSSSAGSGKTFALTTRLISMLLSGIRLSEILAITFTNLAANDIRKKLFDRVQKIEKQDEKETLLFSDILNEPPDVVIEKALGLKAKLIKQFNLLHISTIHSFFAKIAKCFPRETGVMTDIVIIDETMKGSILQESMERFYRALENDYALFHRISNFILHFEESGLTTRQAVIDIFSKVDQKHYVLKDLFSRIDNLNRIHKEFLSKKNGLCSVQMQEKMCFLLGIMSCYTEKHGRNRNVESFSRGLEFFLTYKNINRLAGLTPFKRDNAGMINYLEKIRNTLPAGQAHLFTEALAEIRSALISYLFTQMNYYVLTWIDIYERINFFYRDIKKAGRVVDFADIEEYALHFLSQLTDFDYLHYRIGSEIKYILIDEFQDTSELQWDALRFLVKGSLKNELKDYSIQDVVNIIHLVLNPDEAIYVSGLLRSPLFRSSYDNLHRWKDVTGAASI